MLLVDLCLSVCQQPACHPSQENDSLTLTRKQKQLMILFICTSVGEGYFLKCSIFVELFPPIIDAFFKHASIYQTFFNKSEYSTENENLF